MFSRTPSNRLSIWLQRYSLFNRHWLVLFPLLALLAGCADIVPGVTAGIDDAAEHDLQEGLDIEPDELVPEQMDVSIPSGDVMTPEDTVDGETELTATSEDLVVAKPFEPWTLVVLPDTQYYSDKFNDVFMAQTEWIAKNAKELNIRFVAHVGDVTNWNKPEEYKVAADAFAMLQHAAVPFALVTGNHDYEGNAEKRVTLLNSYMSPDVYVASDRFGLFEPDRIENSWHRFTVSGLDYLLLALEFGPRKEVVLWAKDIARENPGAAIILLTHAYLYDDDSRFDWWKKGESQRWNPHSYPMADEPGGVQDGEELWGSWLQDEPNAMLVLCGHTLGDGIGHAVDRGTQGNVVHQLLANFQTGCDSDLPDGGAGFLRLLRFEEPRRIAVTTYSPYWDKFLTDPDNDFVMTFAQADYDDPR